MPDARIIIGAIAVVVGIGFFIYEAFSERNNSQNDHSYENNTPPPPTCNSSYKEEWEDKEELRRRRRKELKDKNECAICLELKSSTQAIGKLKCGHSFHRSCISKWINMAEKPITCPICRTKIAA